DKCEWVYKTLHETNKEEGYINYIAWSEVFICNNCSEEVVFWNEAVDLKENRVKKEFTCSNCNVALTKRDMERSTFTFYDKFIDKSVTTTKRVPVLINYSYNDQRFYKKPNEYDIKIINEIDKMEINSWFPKNEMLGIGEKWGDTWRAGYHYGITNVHHFYTKRNLYVLSTFYEIVKQFDCDENIKDLLKFVLTGGLLGLTILQRYRPNSGFPNMILSGTLYVSSLMREWNVVDWLEGKYRAVLRAKNIELDGKSVVHSTSSISGNNINANSIDYIFTDPPFGGNLMYSELNYLWESWIKVTTNNENEAIVNKSHNKDNKFYYNRMLDGF